MVLLRDIYGKLKSLANEYTKLFHAVFNNNFKTICLLSQTRDIDYVQS